MGDIIARIYSDQAPSDGFESVELDLEDVYFCVMKDIARLHPSALTESTPTANATSV